MKSNGKARSSTFSLHDRTYGPVKIKDGLFLGDELAARVTTPYSIGLGFYRQQQSYSYYQYRREENPQPMGEVWSHLPFCSLAG